MVSRGFSDASEMFNEKKSLEKSDYIATTDEIAKKLNLPESEVVYALDAISDTVSLYDPVFNSQDDTLLLMDQLGDQKNTDEKWTEKVALDQAMQQIGEREKLIIYLRYYEGKTQTEISKEVGISQAQVSRLEKTALVQIRNSIRA